MYGVVDRFEGKFVVIETDDGRIVNIEKHLFPNTIKEGDVVDLESKSIDIKETQRRKNSIQHLVDELFD